MATSTNPSMYTFITLSSIHEVTLRCTVKKYDPDGCAASWLRDRSVIVFNAASAQEAVSIAQDSVRNSTRVVSSVTDEYVVQSSDLISVVPLQEAVITAGSLMVEAP